MKKEKNRKVNPHTRNFIFTHENFPKLAICMKIKLDISHILFLV